MRDYGMQPFDVGRYTTAEIKAVLADQDAYYKALKEQQRAVSRGR